MKTKTETILIALKVLAWFAMIGCAVNLGSQIISFVVSLYNPVAAANIPGVDQPLIELLSFNFQYYCFIISLVIVISAMYTNLWYLVIQLLSKLHLKSPFTLAVAKKLESISYSLISIWLVGFLGKNYIDWVSKGYGEKLNVISHTNEFLFVAGIVYIISQVFKHGVEIQEENLQTI